jgi:rRNA-processing protein FCF1
MSSRCVAGGGRVGEEVEDGIPGSYHLHNGTYPAASSAHRQELSFMRLNTLFRLLGTVLYGFIGWEIGITLVGTTELNTATWQIWLSGRGAVGAAPARFLLDVTRGWGGKKPVNGCSRRTNDAGAANSPAAPVSPAGPELLLDTSVIIDGRIADIAKTGFLLGTLTVPRFVLNELQYIADSADSLRRNRGRRGLEVLDRLQNTPEVKIVFSDQDPADANQVDDKLISLARQSGALIITNDYNLNRVARLQGVRILNINELANAIKSVYLPGEEIPLKIIQEGKEMGQGVGYLEDGTMVVVENGRRYINQEVLVQVTKVLQTNAGRLIFATPE